MATIKSNSGKTPEIHPTAYIAEGVVIIGAVRVGKESSVWFNSVLRGDINAIEIGERTNIQDLSVAHVTKDLAVKIGSGVTIGHRATIHGAVIEDSCLIGMGAVLLDGVHVGHHSLVAAGSLVRENFRIPEGMLVAGVPAVVKRALTKEERLHIEQSAVNYVQYAKTYREKHG